MRIKRCPNPICGGQCNDENVDHVASENMWYVECKLCHMNGPTAGNKTGAIRLWNGLPRVIDIEEVDYSKMTRREMERFLSGIEDKIAAARKAASEQEKESEK